MKSSILPSSLAVAGFALAAFAWADVPGDAPSEPSVGPAASGLSAKTAQDNGYAHGYALVYHEAQLLADVHKLLVKGQRNQLEDVTRAVARAASTIVERLAGFAETTESIVLEDDGLPLVETAARERMQKSVRRDLILATGCDFEKRLLLAESAGVGKLVALIEEMAAAAEQDEERALWRGLHDEITPTYERVVALYSDDCTPR